MLEKLTALEASEAAVSCVAESVDEFGFAAAGGVSEGVASTVDGWGDSTVRALAVSADFSLVTVDV